MSHRVWTIKSSSLCSGVGWWWCGGLRLLCYISGQCSSLEQVNVYEMSLCNMKLWSQREPKAKKINQAIVAREAIWLRWWKGLWRFIQCFGYQVSWKQTLCRRWKNRGCNSCLRLVVTNFTYCDWSGYSLCSNVWYAHLRRSKGLLSGNFV